MMRDHIARRTRGHMELYCNGTKKLLQSLFKKNKIAPIIGSYCELHYC